MAKLQQLALQYATGPFIVPDASFIVRPANADEQAACDSQKMRSPAGTISFSVIGIAIILIVGAISVFTNLVLDTVVGFV